MKIVKSSTYLKAKDLEEITADVTVESVDEEDLPQTGLSIVVKFAEFENKLPLNATNRNALIDLLGDETDAWKGRVVVLVKVPTKNPQTGASVEGIRVMEKKVKKKKGEA